MLDWYQRNRVVFLPRLIAASTTEMNRGFMSAVLSYRKYKEVWSLCWVFINTEVVDQKEEPDHGDRAHSQPLLTTSH